MQDEEGEGMPRHGRRHADLMRGFAASIPILLIIAGVITQSSFIAGHPLNENVRAAVEKAAETWSIADKAGEGLAGAAESNVHPLLTRAHDALAKAQSTEPAEGGKDTKSYVNAGSSISDGSELPIDFILKSMGRKAPVVDADVNVDKLKAEQSFGHSFGKNRPAGFSSTAKPKASGSSTTGVELRVVGVLKAQADPEEIKQFLVGGCGIKDITIVGRGVYAWVPAENVPCLASVDGILSWSPSLVSHTNHGEGRIISQGVQAMRVDLVQSRWGVLGNGTKVGILTNSFDACRNATSLSQAAGELPTQLEILSDVTWRCGQWDADEGRAAAEIVHDVAPGAAIAFHTALNGQPHFANGIRRLAAAGCDVILDTLYYYAEPMFFDGIIAQAVNEVTHRGTHYFVSAGNVRDNAYNSPFVYSGVTVGSPWFYHFHDFDPSNETVQEFTVLTGDLSTWTCIMLQWDQPWATQGPWATRGLPGAESDLDLLVFSNATGELLDVSASTNTDGDPFEQCCFMTDGSSVNVFIGLYDGPPPANMKLVLDTDRVQFATFPTNGATVRGHQAAAMAVSVSAAYYVETPAFNASLTSAILERFSSKGGTRILFNEDGDYLGPEGIVRPTPSLVGPDGVDTSFFPPGGDSDNSGHPNFFGTSASTPHVAALAALFIGAVKPYVPPPSPEAMRALLQATADEMGDPGWDYWTGAGFVNGTRLFEVGLGLLREHDRNALVAFRVGLDADVAASVLSSWRDDTDHCEWMGVACAAGAPYVVVGLNLPGRGLRGTVSPLLGNLTALKSLDLSSNELGGEIPATLADLAVVETIDLSGNQLQGSIPFAFERLSSLSVLDVSSNAGLTGCIPYHLLEVTAASGTGIPTGSGHVCGDTIENPIPVLLLPFHYEADSSVFHRDYNFDAGCQSEWPDPSAPDLVFSFTPESDGVLVASLCGSEFNTVVTILAVDDPLVRPVCNDDSSVCGTSVRASEGEKRVVANTTYYVVVSGYADEHGNFSLRLRLAPVPPAHVLAQERAAFEAFLGYVSALLVEGAYREVETVESLCDLREVTCQGGRIAGLLVPIDEGSNGTFTGIMQQPLLGLKMLKVVQIFSPHPLVRSCTLGALSSVLRGEELPRCGDTPEKPVVIPSLPFVYRDDTSKGFAWDVDEDKSCQGYPAPDVVFEYVAEVTAPVALSTCMPYALTYDTYIYAYAADDLLGHSLCDDDGCGRVGGPSFLQFFMEAGQRYIIVVSGWQDEAGPFRLDINVDVSINTTWVGLQRDILLAFKDAVVDNSGVLSGWVGDNYCSWNGIYCGNGLTIRALDMFHAGLSGPSVPAVLGQLTNLSWIDLSGNDFEGSIPEELAGGPGDDARPHVDLVFNGNARMTGCVPDAIVYKRGPDGTRMFVVYIVGTRIGGACALVGYQPSLTCPSKLLLADVSDALSYFPYSFEEGDITLEDTQEGNIYADDPVITCDPSSSSPFFEGDTPVTCHGHDLDGNEANCTFNATVTVTEETLSSNPPPYLTVVTINLDTVEASTFTPTVWAQLFAELFERPEFENVTVWRARAAAWFNSERIDRRRARSLLQDGVSLTIHFGAPTAAGIATVEAWFQDRASAMAMQGVFSQALGVSVGLPVVASVQTSGSACCLPPSPNPVCLVDPDSPISSSDECAWLAWSLLPSATQDAIWLGRTGQCGECAARWDSAGAKSDPHFVTAKGEHFDWMGQGDRSFCIISDKAVHVNAHLFAGTDGLRKGTWIDQIAVLHDGDNIVVSTGNPAGLPGLYGSVSLNGRADTSVGSSSSAVVGKGLTMRRKKTRTWVTVEGVLELEVEVVRASTWEAGRGPARDFLNFRVHGLNATESVHGVLGQTFRPTAQGATKSALKGLVEGTDPDYMTSGLLAADCSFSQFVPAKRMSDV
eukprot:jgi/Mesvir1/16944/Mv25090-RA.1